MAWKDEDEDEEVHEDEDEELDEELDEDEDEELDEELDEDEDEELDEDEDAEVDDSCCCRSTAVLGVHVGGRWLKKGLDLDVEDEAVDEAVDVDEEDEEDAGYVDEEEAENSRSWRWRRSWRGKFLC